MGLQFGEAHGAVSRTRISQASETLLKVPSGQQLQGQRISAWDFVCPEDISWRCEVHNLCGIAGFTHKHWVPPTSRIYEATATLIHRGPDQQACTRARFFRAGRRG